MSNSVTNPPTSSQPSTPNSSSLPNPLVEQVDKVKQILFTKDTAATLGQSVRIVFVLLKETLMLVWLALCWGIVAIGWAGTKTTQAGQDVKSWWVTLQDSHQNQTASNIAAETGKSVLNSSKTMMEQIVTQAKKQVGLPEE